MMSGMLWHEVEDTDGTQAGGLVVGTPRVLTNSRTC